jgi:hypothetical protein
MFFKSLFPSNIQYCLSHLTNPCIRHESTVLIRNSNRHDGLQLHTLHTKSSEVMSGGGTLEQRIQQEETRRAR